MTQIAGSAMLNAYLEEWSVLTEKAENQRVCRLGGMHFGNVQRSRKAQNGPSGSGGQGRIQLSMGMLMFLS
jgi:hypothetical protein